MTLAGLVILALAVLAMTGGPVIAKIDADRANPRIDLNDPGGTAPTTTLGTSINIGNNTAVDTTWKLTVFIKFPSAESAAITTIFDPAKHTYAMITRPPDIANQAAEEFAWIENSGNGTLLVSNTSIIVDDDVGASPPFGAGNVELNTRHGPTIVAQAQNCGNCHTFKDVTAADFSDFTADDASST